MILISRTADDPELMRVKGSMRRKDRETTPQKIQAGIRQTLDKMGLVFMDDQIVVPAGLRRRLLYYLSFGHARTTKMLAEAVIFWWQEINRDIEIKVKNCTACLASGTILKHHLPRNHYGKLKKLTTDPAKNYKSTLSRNYKIGN